jgi:hypothetical protein
MVSDTHRWETERSRDILIRLKGRAYYNMGKRGR